MRRPILLLFIAVLTGLSACSTTPRPITNVDPAADFASYRTFGFIENPSTNTREYESLVTTFLKAAGMDAEEIESLRKARTSS